MIQWFPGHMAKALRQIKEKEMLADLFIVVLDARAPLSSYNEEFDKIAPQKPRLFVLAKEDYCDHYKLDKILSKFANTKDKVVIVNLKKASARKKIMDGVQIILETKRKKEIENGIVKPRLRAIVVGVPNSGKSTLINLLSGSSKAKVGNMPGVTRGQQWINANEIQLLDTPGILWPKFEDPMIGIKLAIIGSIKIERIPKKELFYEGFKLLAKYYPTKLEQEGLVLGKSESEMYSSLYNMCESKKMFKSQNQVDVEKGLNWFMTYLRDLKGVTYD